MKNKQYLIELSILILAFFLIIFLISREKPPEATKPVPTPHSTPVSVSPLPCPISDKCA